MRRVLSLILLCGCAASNPAYSEDLVVSMGKQHAASSGLQWEVREANHPVLGPVRFAFLKSPIATPVGTSRVFSNIYVSCEKSRRKIAIELANGTAPDDPGGLQPKAKPRLVCNNLAAPNEPRIVQDDVTAHWKVSPIGDALAQGISSFALRECVSIDIVQDVVLPKGWSRESVAIEFRIAPYGRDLDSIFATCGQVTAYAPATQPATTASQGTEAPWKQARTTSRGKTNVRTKPNLDSAVVIELYPGDIILAQRTGTPWWHVKSRPNRPPFEGYIREDRLVFR